MHNETQQDQHHVTAASGFTLLEALISLMLLSMMLLALPSSLKLANAIRSTSAKVEKNSAALLLAEKVRAQLLEVRTEFKPNSQGGLELQFDGSEHSLDFMALSLSGPAGPGLYRFKIGATMGESETPGVLYTQSLFRPGGGPDIPQTERTSVSRRLLGSRFSFRYFGQVEGGMSNEWQDHWHARPKLPTMVAIKFHVDDMTPPSTNTLIVPLMLGHRSVAAR